SVGGCSQSDIKRALLLCCFFFQAEDGIRDRNVTGVQTCALGLTDDARSYDAAAAILRYEGCSRIRLLSSNPAKSTALQSYGITVTERLHLQLPDRPENSAYLESKRRRMNHDIPNGHPDLEEGDELEVYRTSAGFDEVVAQLAQ